jgi:Tfp pilus assembly protein FimT
MNREYPPYLWTTSWVGYNRFKKNGTSGVCRRLRNQVAAGFSLLEALLVLTILCLAGSAAVPHFISWRGNMSLRSAVTELKGNLESAKTLAVKENTTISVEFKPAEGRYRLTCKDPDDNDVSIKEAQLPAGVKIDATHPAYTVSGNKTNFNSRGGAKNCTIVFTNTSGKSKRVAVSIIGKIEVKD